MDKVRCIHFDSCYIPCGHKTEHNEFYECHSCGVGSGWCKPIVTKKLSVKVKPLSKTFKAWAISDVIDGERKLLDITSNDNGVVGVCPLRYKARRSLAKFKSRYQVSHKARVERVKITVEVG